MTDTITAAAIVEENALPMIGQSLKTFKVEGSAGDAVIEGVRSVVLWADHGSAIMRLIVAGNTPLTMRQLVRALQCGYLVSAQRACRWGDFLGVVGEHVAQGCRISTDNMPHDVEYQPNWKVRMSVELEVESYEAAIDDNGRLDVILNVRKTATRIIPQAA